MGSTQFWHRVFNRQHTPDQDLLANSAFLEANFKDFFGTWLQEGSNAQVTTLDDLLMSFYGFPEKFKFQIYCVSDGGDIKATDENSAWLEQNIRFVSIITPSSTQAFTPGSWTLAVVGSQDLHSPNSFLQVASWDGTGFRFYERSFIHNPNASKEQGWVYIGISTSAFTEKDMYLGPFNGHVNGAVIQKELHQPWLRWMTSNTRFAQNFPPSVQTLFTNTPYLSSNGVCCSKVGSAEQLETIVEAGVDAWFGVRAKTDFFSGGQLKPKPSSIIRWMAHLLLKTTINIIPAVPVGGSSRTLWIAPADHFYNQEMLGAYSYSDLMTGVKVPNLQFQKADYDAAQKKLELVRLQEVFDPKRLPKNKPLLTLPKGTLGGGKLTNSYNLRHFVVAETGEGEEGPFTILQPSYEDAQGVITMQNIVASRAPPGSHEPPPISLLSYKTFNALMMVDFWNPIYSWRRAVLMQYVPESATYDPSTKTYDLEMEFITNVKRSSFYTKKVQGSPEAEFISLLDKYDLSSFQQRIGKYLQAVQKALKTTQGIHDYLALAESRRRIYRPIPLDEFGLTLPYALKYSSTNATDANAHIEMTENGTIIPMDPRGINLYQGYTETQEPGSLAGFDPDLFPSPDNGSGASLRGTTGASNSTLHEMTLPVRRGCPRRRGFHDMRDIG